MEITVADNPNGIAFFQLLARRGALSLEIKGMTRHGRSAYSICKQVYNLRGSRTSVLAQMDNLIAQAKQQAAHSH